MALRHPRFAGDERLQMAALNSPPLRKHETGEAILILQRALTDIGFHLGTRTGQPDGVFGEATIAIHHQFHVLYGVTDESLGGRSSIGALDAIFQKIEPHGSTPHLPSGPHLRAPMIPHTILRQLQATYDETDAHLGGRTSVTSDIPVFLKPGHPAPHHPGQSGPHQRIPRESHVIFRPFQIPINEGEATLGGRTSVASSGFLLHKPGTPVSHPNHPGHKVRR